MSRLPQRHLPLQFLAIAALIIVSTTRGDATWRVTYKCDEAVEWVNGSNVVNLYCGDVWYDDGLSAGGVINNRSRPYTNDGDPSRPVKGGGGDPVSGDGEFVQVDTDVTFPGEG